MTNRMLLPVRSPACRAAPVCRRGPAGRGEVSTALRIGAADRRHQMPLEGRRFPTALTVVLILAVVFVLIVLLWPLGGLPWP